MSSIGIYIHFPFCKKKCIYCDFYSTTKLDEIPIYLNALKLEIQKRIEKLLEERLIKANEIDTIFFGGGTPSLLQPQQYETILGLLKQYFSIQEDVEITIECNPRASDAKYFAELRQLGINRISIGVQSFLDPELRFLGRIHTSEDALYTIEQAQKHFDNVSIDLIFGLPKQTIENVEYSLRAACEFDLKHISVYSLIYEEGTPLYEKLASGTISPLDDELSAEMYLFISSFLHKRAFEHYEISNYAKYGFRCRHNLKYWLLQDTLAFGPSAVGYLNNMRYKNTTSLNEYIQKLQCGILPESFIEQLTLIEKITERVFLSLRSTGLDLAKFRNEFGLDLAKFASKEIEHLIKNEFATLENKLLKLTPKGYYICDEITLQLLKKIEMQNVQNIR